jgi:hypothetical protein
VAKNVESRVEQFGQELESALGTNMVSLTLYGSAARDHQTGERSDINLLLIVRDASAKALRGATTALAAWSRSGQTPPLIFSEAEWRASADVFPIEMEDVRDAHRVIRGQDPVAGISTDAANVRQQLEREVRAKLLHLRTEYAVVAGEPKALTRLLENSLGTFLVLFRATLRLKGVTPPADAAALIRETAKAAGLDPVAFDWTLASRSGKAKFALTAFDPLAMKYLDGIEQLARVVNEL